MTIKEAVLKSLDEIQKPIGSYELCDYILSKEYVEFKGKTPHNTVSAHLTDFIYKNDKRVKRVKKQGGNYLYYLSKYEDIVNVINYNQPIKEIVKKQNLNVKIVEAGMRINIEKNLYFDVLWPDSQKMISDNAINNNSLVCKLNYNKFSMLFTGDIEEIAEKEIVSKYENNTSILKSTILKTAHHGSKTSSIEKILDVVKPQYAFIGVGENNTFGHPSNITIENLEKRKIKIYRTDKMGEICIKITKKAIIKINTKLNTS